MKELEEALELAKSFAIEDGVLTHCLKEGDVKLPDSVRRIASGAFRNALYVTSVTIGKAVEEIDIGAFSGTELETIAVDLENRQYYVSGNCLIHKATRTIVYATADAIIPAEGVERIGESAFRFSNISDWQVTIPGSIKEIGPLAFYGCLGLSTVCFSEGLESIADNAFRSTGLVSVSLPSTLTSLGTLSFAECFQLSQVTGLHDGMMIADTAFYRDFLDDETLIARYGREPNPFESAVRDRF